MKTPRHRNMGLLVFPLLAGMTISGCAGKPQLIKPVLTPPYVPAPPAQEEKVGVTLDMSAIRSYADLADGSDDRLRQAVSHAVSLGILSPQGAEDRFEPDKPVSYGDFRKWAMAYRNGPDNTPQPRPHPMKPGTSLPDNPASGPMNPSRASDPLPPGIHYKELRPVHPAGSTEPDPMNPRHMTRLPLEMTWGKRHMGISHALTRDAFCVLYVMLTRQEDKARGLSREAIEAMTPKGRNDASDAAFSQFMDYNGIPDWARPAVALAYRDGVLLKVFGLSPSRLSIEDGFGPGQPVTRQEAIIFLDGLFGRASRPLHAASN